MGVQYTQFNEVNMNDIDAVVVGSGFAGGVVARELAERAGKRVLIIEKRPHIGGNMYDEKDEAGILVHKYGPHIFHSNDKRAFDYARRFSGFLGYQHRVLADWYGTYMPVPFNKNSMEIAFGEEKAAHYIEKLIDTFGDERKVTINELREQDDPELAEIADFVYKNVFLYYTQKQWGLTPEEVDPSVTARVPVFISRDNRYFQDAYQGMPVFGYTKLFEEMLDHENIQVCLNTEAESVFELEFESEAEDAPLSAIKLHGKKFEGPIVYTGPLDELFGLDLGALPYRTLDLDFETLPVDEFQPVCTVNYTTSEDFTRITEFKHMTGQVVPGKTTILREYSKAYEPGSGQTPYYAILEPQNKALYASYLERVAGVANFHAVGRLAEYRYYDMDAVVASALALADKLVAEA